MAKENPQASDENELEIEAESSEEEISDDSSSEEDETETREAYEGEWYEKSYLLEHMINCGSASEDAAKERWRMLSTETRKKMEEEFRDLLVEEMRLARRKAKFLRDLAATLGVVIP